MIAFSQQPIDVQAVLEAVRTTQAGALVLFLGTVRSRSQGKVVVGLEYECYPEMAHQVLSQLVEQAKARWNLLGCAVVHRTGRVLVGEVSVAIACSAPHRADAFAAAQWLIDQLKHHVPIWKKEYYTDGTSQWVSAAGSAVPGSLASGESA